MLSKKKNICQWKCTLANDNSEEKTDETSCDFLTIIYICFKQKKTIDSRYFTPQENNIIVAYFIKYSTCN